MVGSVDAVHEWGRLAHECSRLVEECGVAVHELKSLLDAVVAQAMTRSEPLTTP